MLPLDAVGSPSEIVDLALGGPDHDLGVDQAGGPDHLLGDRRRHLQLVGPGRGRQEDHLVDELLEAQRPVGRRRQPEAVLDQLFLAGAVALVLPVELRYRLMALVDDQQEVVGEEVDQRVGRLTPPSILDGAEYSML